MNCRLQRGRAFDRVVAPLLFDKSRHDLFSARSSEFLMHYFPSPSTKNRGRDGNGRSTHAVDSTTGMILDGCRRISLFSSTRLNDFKIDSTPNVFPCVYKYSNWRFWNRRIFHIVSWNLSTLHRVALERFHRRLLLRGAIVSLDLYIYKIFRKQWWDVYATRLVT